MAAKKKTPAKKATAKGKSEAPKKKAAAKAAPAKKATAKKAQAKKAPAKKAPAKKTAVKKAATKKAPAKKAAVRKATVKKTAAKKVAVKKTVAKKPAAKKAGVKKAAPKKAAAKKTARKAVAKATRKAAVRKTAVKKGAVRKAVSGKTAAKKPVAKKTAVKKSAPRKAAAKKTNARPAVRHAVTAARKAPARSPARKAVSKATAPKRAAPAASLPRGVEILGAMGPRFDEILTPAALEFIAGMHRAFNARRLELLARRDERQKLFDAGETPDFLEETRSVRDSEWSVAPIPYDLLDRRVEITGPVDRKMIINALNSGAKVFMADFEDASSPTWANMIEGQINLKDRWAGKLDFTDPASGKAYKLSDKPAVLMVRARGWHLTEAHMRVDGEEVHGGIFDFGLYFFHNAKAQIAQGFTPAFYLPKMESHLEARLWNDVFVHAQKELGVPNGTIKATVLIETLPAAFEMDEILYELRDHMAGLNSGRWDYIFSFIKRVGKSPRFLTPDRGVMVMGKAFLNAYAQLLVKTCHRRKAFAMGGMAAQIPVKNNPEANEIAFAKVRADKEREAGSGYDGTWVAHPDLVPVAMEVFDRLMPQPNQREVLRGNLVVTRDELLQMHEGARSEGGLRENIRVGVQYIEAWLGGRGAVPLYNLMEDAATAEISRAQVWQWINLGAELDDGRRVTPELFSAVLDDEMAKLRETLGPAAYDAGKFEEAVGLFSSMSLAKDFEEFLTVPAYRLLG